MRHKNGHVNRVGTVSLTAVLLTLTFALSSCSWSRASPATSTGSATSLTGTAVSIAFPDSSGRKATANSIAVTTEMRAAAPNGMTIHEVVDLAMTKGTFPKAGARLKFTLVSPLAQNMTATIVHWNEESGGWEPLSTGLSADRRDVSAKLVHFSTYAWFETLYNGLGQFFGEKTTPPACDGSKDGSKPDWPAWADPKFFDDINGPVLWCAGTDPKNSDFMEVRLKLNRSTAGSITTGIKPASAHSDLWDALSPETWATVALDGDIPSALMSNAYLIQPLGEYDFEFNKTDLLNFWHAGRDKPLVQVDSQPLDLLAGYLYEAVSGSAAGPLAYITTIMSLVQCGSDVVNAASDSSVAGLLGTVASCLNARAEDISKAAVRCWLKMKPDANVIETTSRAISIGKVIGLAAVIYAAAKVELSVASVIGDLYLNPIARQIIFQPSDAALKEYLAAHVPLPPTKTAAWIIDSSGIGPFKIGASWPDLRRLAITVGSMLTFSDNSSAGCSWYSLSSPDGWTIDLHGSSPTSPIHLFSANLLGPGSERIPTSPRLANGLSLGSPMSAVSKAYPSATTAVDALGGDNYVSVALGNGVPGYFDDTDLMSSNRGSTSVVRQISVGETDPPAEYCG